MPASHTFSAPPANVRKASGFVQECIRELFGLATATQRELPDPDLLIEILRQNKLSVQILALIKDRHPKLDHAYLNHRLRTVALNARCLQSATQAQDALAGRGVRFLIFKGPPQQAQLYKDCYARPCADLDILVARSDFATARKALQDIGYVVQRKSASLWWNHFLGEQHLRHESGSVIDLHHRLHQPGSPGPKTVRPFIDRGRPYALNSAQYMVPPLEDILLICCINLAKALFNREPCGGYVCDVAAALIHLQPGGLATCRERATELEMEGILQLGMRAASAVLERPLPVLPNARQFLTGVDDATLRDMLLTPLLPDLRWIGRRDVLWALCSERAGRYFTELGWAFASEAGRRIFARGDA